MVLRVQTKAQQIFDLKKAVCAARLVKVKDFKKEYAELSYA